ncbi:phospholipase B [Lingula anatina]|uniref:Phospholipase B-like n=1 Tax=Lingula anatina TaxID=7574 RepID=A0A1S3K5L9_LINAN|nr:phospholipase B [Lingula anatina]|eukprot:XP_013417551.1 phospholipase B [Lingula anatina]
MADGRACCRAAIVLTVFICYAKGEFMQGSLYVNAPMNFTFKSDTLDTKNAAAYATYNDTLLTTGWGVLDIKAGYGKTLPDNQLMFAAGAIEGVLTAKRMYQHYTNMYGVFLNGKSDKVIDGLKSFYNAQDKWIRQQIEKNLSDPFWRHVWYILCQLDGLYLGYKYMADQKVVPDIGFFGVQFLNGAGDLLDLMNVIDPDSRPDFSKMTPDEIQSYIASSGHCSALVKVTGAYENIFMSHSSWFVYAATLRIYKHYDFNVRDKDTAARQLSFSSYPGFLESLDDFYIMGNNIVVLQTTNNVFNMSLYDYVKPQSVFAWQRVRVANMMARNGQQWGEIINTCNSGTYNNQYMVINLNQVHLGKSLDDGTLYVVEQIPSLVKYADVTPILRDGHWPSYNVPFFESVYNLSGYPDFVRQHGLDRSYQMAPRAKIFRRDAGKVTDMDSMMKIMRYNDYLHDPYSDKKPCNAICCRGDLDPKNPKADGCYDTKVTDFAMAQKRMSYAISGPTLGTGLPPFVWSPKFNVSHIGLPPKYNFGFVMMHPRF